MEVREDFDQLPYYFEVQCDYCGKPFVTTKQRYKKNKTQCCSNECKNKLHKSKSNCKCAVCGKEIYRKPYQLKKIKNITCSYECCYKLKKQTMAGENNHQYGLKGSLNASYKDGEFISTWGYKKIYAPSHPEARGNYVFEHRLVAESYLMDDVNSYDYNGYKTLSSDYVVHHLDFDRLNNDINNLVVMKKNDHTKFHNTLKEIIRDEEGRIKKIIKHNNQLSKQELRNKFFEYVDQNNIYYNAFPTARIDKKIMELALIPYVDYDIVIETDSLSESERGEGGFGSTGK